MGDRWTGTGECVVGLAFAGRVPSGLPAGAVAVPGPHLVVAARYETSPVGPYLELAVAAPVRAGARLGVCVTTMVVDSEASRDAGRETWGFPKELGTLRWSTDGPRRALRWEERAIEVRGVAAGPAVPGLLLFGALQERAQRPVRVWGRLLGRARWATVEVDVPAGDPLAGLGGRHRGAAVTGARLHMGPPRPRRSP